MNTPASAFAFLALASAAAHGQNVLYDLSLDGDNHQLALAPCGDVDGDGLPDFLLGEASDDTVALQAGAVRVRSGPTGAVLLELYGAGIFDYAGSSVDGPGDVDADGFPDVLAGADGGSYARVWSGAGGSLLHDLPGATAFDFFGTDVAGVGDADLDGFADFAVSAPQNEVFNPGPGYVRVYSGASGAVLDELTGACEGSRFGASIAGLGNADGDGAPELAVYQPGGLCGLIVRIFTVGGAELFYLPGIAPDTLKNYGLARAGDLDGDALPDLVIGSPGFGSCAGPSEGSVAAYSLAGGGLLFEADGDPGCSMLGWSVSSAGDWNGDGREDVAGGATGAQYIDVLSGVDGASLARIDSYGWGVAGVGDVNGDGFVEVASINPGGGAWVHSACPGAIEAYGLGCKGTNGFIPELSATGCPNPGQALAFELEQGFGGQPALLAVGSGSASLPIGLPAIGLAQCHLLVAPITFVAQLGSLASFGPGAGSLGFSIKVPAAAAGAAFFFQAACVDPFTPNGFAVSNGLRVEVE